MLFRSRNRLKRAGRAILALVAGLWLSAALTPCAMAMATVVPMPDMNCLSGNAKTSDRSADVGVVSVEDCHLPEIAPHNNLSLPGLDIPAASVPAVPLVSMPVRLSVSHRYLRESVSIPKPPPLLRNLVLLI